MNVSALLTSAGINTAICVVLISLYSILRKQPSNFCVYFGRMLSGGKVKRHDPIWYERFAPSPSWLVKAWETTEDEMLAAAGLDAVVFIRMVICSIRIFSVVAVVCISFVLPVNYYGHRMQYKEEAHLESLGVFTIENLQQRSRWLWVHCLSLYIITSAACALLYFEYKAIAEKRLAYLTGSASKLSHFTVLMRAVPQSPEQSYYETVTKYFTKFYAPSYLSHLMVYRDGIIQRLLHDAERICQAVKLVSPDASSNPSLKSDSVKKTELGECSSATMEELMQPRDRNAPTLGLNPFTGFQGTIPNITTTTNQQYNPLPQTALESELQSLYQMGFVSNPSTMMSSFSPNNGRLKPEL